MFHGARESGPFRVEGHRPRATGGRIGDACDPRRGQQGSPIPEGQRFRCMQARRLTEFLLGTPTVPDTSRMGATVHGPIGMRSVDYSLSEHQVDLQNAYDSSSRPLLIETSRAAEASGFDRTMGAAVRHGRHDDGLPKSCGGGGNAGRTDLVPRSSGDRLPGAVDRPRVRRSATGPAGKRWGRTANDTATSSNGQQLPRSDLQVQSGSGRQTLTHRSIADQVIIPHGNAIVRLNVRTDRATSTYRPVADGLGGPSRRRQSHSGGRWGRLRWRAINGT